MVRRFSKKTKTKVISVPRSAEIPQAIQERAYRIWENKGRPSNSELENWLEAKKQLKVTE